MNIEHVRDRALGAARFIDAETLLPIRTRLIVASPAARVIANASNVYVIAGLRTGNAVTDAAVEAFIASLDDPAAQPAQDSLPLELTVTDPGGRYLARRFSMALPRRDAATRFSAVEVTMYPAPIARPLAGATILRVTASSPTGEPRPGALIAVSVEISDTVKRKVYGLSDARGEALVLVPGVPTMRWADNTEENVIAQPFPASVGAAFDSDAEWPPDPSTLEGSIAWLPDDIEITSGIEQRITMKF